MKIYYIYAPINELFPDRQVTRSEVYAITDDKGMKNQFLSERADFFQCRVDKVEKEEWEEMRRLTSVAEKILGYYKFFTFDHKIAEPVENRVKEMKLLCTYSEHVTIEESLETVFATKPFNVVMEIPGKVFRKEIQKNLCRLQVPSIIRAKHSNDSIGLSIDDFKLENWQIDTAEMDDWDVIQPEVTVDEVMFFLVLYAHLFK